MYKKKLKKRISYLLDNNTKISFQELCKKCLGAFPFIIYSLLNEKQKKTVTKITPPTKDTNSNFLPSENPANYDWRFTKETCNNLSKLIQGNNYKIALFGTPSLYLELLKSNEDVHLFDINSLLTRHLPKQSNIHIVDLNTHTFDLINEFDCVFLDPPWYNNYYAQWISQANSITKKGGVIYTSLFQKLLRPKAIKERLKILSSFSLIGDVEIKENLVNYITPAFEKEVFDYYHIPISDNWRIADLVQIQNEVKISTTKDFPKEDSWLRFEINEISISLQTNNNNGKVNIKSPYKNGDSLLKTISLRNEIKRKVNFITSRNKGYIVTGTKKLALILREIEKGNPLMDIYTRYNLDKEEIHQISNLLMNISE